MHVAKERFPWHRSHGEGWKRLGAEITSPGTRVLGSPAAANCAPRGGMITRDSLTKQVSLGTVR